jgi:hypothetical protein
MSEALDLIDRGDHLFSQRGTLMSFWQMLAANFYPERADFTVSRDMGDSFAEDLMSSYPLLTRRDLGNAIGTMSRPTNIKWFHMTVEDEEKTDQAGKEWLEWASDIMRRAMYDRGAQFNRASKESDHDIACFGQSVKTIETTAMRDKLLYRAWHVRDCAWCENAEGKVDTLHRKWKPTALDLMHIFGDRCHDEVKRCVSGAHGKKEPYRRFEVRHIVCPTEDYNDFYIGKRLPYVSIFIDVENKHIIEMAGLPAFKYVVPRWQTVSGSQYSYSPATVIALPDAKLLQSMTRVLLEAGEKAVSPPLIGVEEAIRGDVPMYAGGITWVDAAYDERLGEVLRPLNIDKSGIPAGMDMSDRVMASIREAFFLNALALPPLGQNPEMTAYEVGQRVQEYIRQAAPIFEPLEDEDNAATCELTFDIMLRNGAFGSWADIPQSVRGQDVKFRFESPLHDAIEKQKGQKFMEASALIGQAASLDESVVAHLDIHTAFRDAMTSIGVPPKWLRGEPEAEAIINQKREAEQQMMLAQQVQQGAEAALTAGQAGQVLNEAMV